MSRPNIAILLIFFPLHCLLHVFPAQIHRLTITHGKTMRLKSSKLKNEGMSVQIKSNHNEMILPHNLCKVCFWIGSCRRTIPISTTILSIHSKSAKAYRPHLQKQSTMHQIKLHIHQINQIIDASNRRSKGQAFTNPSMVQS